MPFFRRPPPPEDAPQPNPEEQRRPVVQCFNCARKAPPYVYMENGHDYCAPCVSALVRYFGFRPAGQRADDITLEEINSD